MEFKRISIDTSKHIFTIHGVDGQDRVILRRDLRRGQMEAFFAKVPATEIALEACAGSHHWGRKFGALGHRVKLIPPQYVKPFVKRGKNDRNDAEAISEAAARPDMRTVPVKTVDEQAATIIVKHREMLVGQRTQAINALRGHAGEFGIVAAKGCGNVAALVCVLTNEAAIPEGARTMFAQMGRHIAELDLKIEAIDRQLLEQHKANPVSQRLAAIPGVGPITAITMAISINPANFESGRHFAAWLGLTPREHSTGGKHRIGRISKAGNERLRQLLVVGAMSVVRYAKPGSKSASTWLLQLLERRPRKIAAIALANKIARIIWAMMARGEAYRRQPASA
ncbi:putative transposase for insertion sequence element (plasmid) [Acidiphilium multivorum AIU301]|jgi:transposase|uniref:Putative transposase for insertion sequence element n=4 Tax=Pseudomonadota TaxID=1224 RepID=F0J7N5_ACIMA|nr:IS110 family transposase [Acidiphilium multivorum]BAJ83102.1 putative transposase for insertion sequence element [Acidiphilium multivorum AIU301]